MHYEHLIEINDESLPWLRPLSRKEIWEGLVMRAEHPEWVLALKTCRVLERGEHFLTRELDFGSFLVRDRVTFMMEHAVVYDIEADDISGQGRLCMEIEEPALNHLFLRFTYDLDEIVSTPEVLGEYRLEAYRQADMDTVLFIRRWADGAENRALH